MKLGDKFSSYEEIERAIKIFGQENVVDFQKRDTRTLGQAVKEKRITPDRAKNEKLKYYQIKYACIFGGRDGYKPKGQGTRKTKTFQCGCTYFIAFLLSDDGSHLVVKNINLEHKNHEVDYRYALH